MKDGTREEYLLLDEYEQDYINGTADRILQFMESLTSTLEGYKITRLEHSLQTATRAYRDKADLKDVQDRETLRKNIDQLAERHKELRTLKREEIDHKAMLKRME